MKKKDEVKTENPGYTNLVSEIDYDNDPHYEQVSLPDIMGKNYVDYAMSVIVSRALPDVRDGFKPVHRRILYAMYKAGITHNVAYRKCATTVGDVLGHFHPHGDASVYDALARLAQDFSMRYPLVDGHGNFGSMDGDPPAAYRYCVTGDTLVSTDRGLVCISEIAENGLNSDTDIDLMVKSAVHHGSHASKLFNSGLHPVYELKTYGGFMLRGTANHPVLVLSEDFEPVWKRMDELKAGDRVMIDLDVANAQFGENDDLEEARMLGCMVSEGYITTQNRVGINNSDPLMIAPVKAYFSKHYGTTAEGSERADGCQEYCVASAEAYRDFVEKYQFGKSETQHVPDCVFAGTEAYVREFLRYLFEGDGSPVYVNDIFHTDVVRNITYTSKSQRLVHEVQSILAMQFGVLSFIRHDKKRDIYTLVIAPGSMKRFDTVIGFVSERKNHMVMMMLDGFEREQIVHNSVDYIPMLDGFVKKLNPDIKRNITNRKDFALCEGHIPELQFVYACDLLDTYAFLPVETIRLTPKQEVVYSVRVDSEDHSFCANGFINHNTEARMASIADEMLRDIDKNTIEWTDNFDGTEKEPVALPSRFPNLLVNGSQGIAVGMACNIPPHNMGEVIDATVQMIDNDLKGQETTVSELLDIVQGPDFPTGAVILGRSYREIYETGRGRVEMEAVYDIEQTGKKSQLVFTEIPYQVNKKTLVESIAKYCREKKLDVADVRDESSREGVRIVVELKRTAIPELVLNNLLQHTQLRCGFSANMLCLVDGQPRTLNLVEMLRYYLDHQLEVVSRRTVFEKDKAEKRKHIVEGLILATQDIDEVINIVRNCKDSDDAKAQLMAKFSLDDVQAQTILDLRLRALTGLERQKLEDELKDLLKEISRCEDVLTDHASLLKLVKKELKEIRRKYADDRRTHHKVDYSDITMEDLVQDEPCVIIRTHMGYLKRMKPGVFRLQKKGGKGSRVATLSADYIEDMISASTLSDLFFFTNQGRVYAMKAYQIAETARTSRGTAMASVLTKLQNGEQVTSMIVREPSSSPDDSLMLMTRKGVAKRVMVSVLPDSLRSSGLFLIKLDDDDEVCSVIVVEDGDNVMVTTRQGYCAAYPVANVRPMGRQARGVKGITLGKGDEVVTMQKQLAGREVVIITERGYAKRVRCEDFTLYKGRTARGIRCIKASNTERIGLVSKAFMIDDASNDLMITIDNGQIIKTPIESIPVYSRTAMGTRMINLSGNPDGIVADVVATAHEEPAEESEEDEADDMSDVSAESSSEDISDVTEVTEDIPEE